MGNVARPRQGHEYSDDGTVFPAAPRSVGDEELQLLAVLRREHFPEPDASTSGGFRLSCYLYWGLLTHHPPAQGHTSTHRRHDAKQCHPPRQFGRCATV